MTGSDEDRIYRTVLYESGVQVFARPEFYLKKVSASRITEVGSSETGDVIAPI